jgi:hypothetical protein
LEPRPQLRSYREQVLGSVADLVVEDIGLVSYLNLRYPTAPCPGDADEDRDIDLRDLSTFRRCFTGSSGSLAAGCERGDADGDNDIDLDDWKRIGGSIFGPW